MPRIAVTAADLTVVPGPAFQMQDEDGPYTDWHVFVVYRERSSEARTWKRYFDRRGEDEAREWIKKIVAHGSINPNKWDENDPWVGYHNNMALGQRLMPFGLEWEREREDARWTCIA